MAGITLDVDTGSIDREDDKTIRVVARDADDNKVTLSAIDLSFTDSNGGVTTYSLTDFNEASKEYSLKHKFDVAGKVVVDITVTDQGGHTERETGKWYVYD